MIDIEILISDRHGGYRYKTISINPRFVVAVAAAENPIDKHHRSNVLLERLIGAEFSSAIDGNILACTAEYNDSHPLCVQR